ncbi:hypothetical protein CHH28_16440 [Bacterioplanes sanyensis]|uniref:Uncharacterized protein n=1 Tax=Bacterioplanes sanyensis TaxID=1249553 RepID=A0A222FNP7_9GAMM|nr:hypothetical protein [Bacterioplanes sanyensis]ASP40166.1 hypothetical protein CHH28_16440 [Bacterioplanes sanyensis]
MKTVHRLIALLVSVLSWLCITGFAHRETSVLEYTAIDSELTVEAAVPTPMELEADQDVESDQPELDIYWTVGGMRLGLLFDEDDLTEEERALNPVRTWVFSVPGRVCGAHSPSDTCQDLPSDTPYSLDSAATPEIDNFKVYWEPLNWDLDLSVDVEVTYDFRNRVVEIPMDGNVFTVDFPERKEQFRIANRVIGPAADGEEPLQGSDVAMLEQMLWQLGVSPQNNNPGSEGARIDSVRYVRNGTNVMTTSCVEEQPQQRDVFLSYTSNGSCTATELMVKRFNARNLENGTLVTPAEVSTARGNVNAETLDFLQRDWESYMTAYQETNGVTPFERDSAGMDGWITEAAQIWQEGIGDRVPATLTDDRYNEILVIAGLTNGSRTRANLLRTWLSHESRFHWGGNDSGYQITAHRMNEGGADENGSLSFSQLLYHYRYGPNPCAAHGEAGFNLYHPRDNLKTMVVHTAADNRSDASSQVCEGGLHRAFVRNALASRYNQANPGENMADLRGFKHGNGAITTVAVNTHEDDYEKLAKAIGIYNSNGTRARPIFTSRSWVGRLRFMEYDENSSANDATTCHSCKYSIEIRNEAETFAGHLRDYIWLGGTATTDINIDADPEIEIRAGEEWCFVYGESEWITHETVLDEGTGQQRRKIFSDFMEDAEDNNLLKTVCG